LLCLQAASTSAIYTLSLHDALPICISGQWNSSVPLNALFSKGFSYSFHRLYDSLDEKGEIQASAGAAVFYASFKHNEYSFSFSRSEEHTSELQSRENLVCRLLLEKK